jgi:Lysyl oxidase
MHRDRLAGRDPADRVIAPCELKSLLTSPLGALRPTREKLALVRVWLHSFLPRAWARLAAGAAIAAAIGAVSLEMPSAILAQSSPTGAGGTTGPSGPPTGPSGPTGPTGSTSPTGPTGSTPCTTASVRLRCPDLVMSAPSDLHIDRTTIPGRVVLRATSSVNNRGSGPLEIRASTPASGGMVVYQAIYDRNGRRHLFHTTAKLVLKYVPGERYEHASVGTFVYWKFEHAAAFELWSIDAQRRAVQLVRMGPKVDYCLRDLIRSRPSISSPKAPVYPACSQNPRVQTDVLGTSVGWSDVYPYEYPEQWIDVTGLHGRFAYVQIADPEDLLIESNHQNNVSETYVVLPSGRVLGHRVDAPTP